MVVNLTVLNSLFTDANSPFDVTNWLFSLPEPYYHNPDGEQYILNGIPQLTRDIYDKGLSTVYVPFVWSDSDPEIKNLRIRVDYSNNRLEIALIAHLVSNTRWAPGQYSRPFGRIVYRNNLYPQYPDIGEINTLDYKYTKNKIINDIPSYVSSGKNLMICLFAIARVFKFKWVYARDKSTIDCEIPFLTYRLLAGKSTLQESRGFVQIDNEEQQNLRTLCFQAIGSIRDQLIDNYLEIAPSLFQYKGMTVGDVFIILNRKRNLENCEDVKRLVEHFENNISEISLCGKFEYVRPVLPNDFPPNFWH